MTPYYEDRFVCLYHGDCLEVMADLAPSWEGFDLVFTSPPYNLGGKSNGNLRASRPRSETRWGKVAIAEGYGAHGDDLPWPAYVAWQQDVLRACWALIADDGAIFYNHKPLIRDKELRLPLECNPGLPLRQIVTWDRSSGFNFNLGHYCPISEWILVLAKRDWHLKNWHASKSTDIWRVDFEQHTPHPAPFPVALPAKAIETTGARRVFDPFAGWATTLLAAKMAGAQAVGIEIEERFCEMAATRLSQETLPLFEGVA